MRAEEPETAIWTFSESSTRRTKPLVEQLAEERRLARAAHPDHRVHLAGHRGEPGVASGQRVWAGRRQGGAQLLGQDGVGRHQARMRVICPSVKDTLVETRSR
jgi:hypothetical protein